MDDERLDDHVADEIRARLMRQVVDERVRTTRTVVAPPPRVRRAWIPVLTSLAVAVVVAVASIAILVNVHPPQPATPQLESARMFDGSCGSVLTPAQAERAIGEAATRPVDTTRSGADVADSWVTSLFTVGGLRCDWKTGRSAKDQAGLVVAAAPVALAPKKAPDPYCFPSSAGGPAQWSCSYSRVSGKVWFSGQLTILKGGKAVALRRLQQLFTAFDTTAKQSGAAVPLPARPAGSWARGTDCAVLARGAKLATALHTPGLVGEPGNGGSEQPAAQQAADRRLGAVPCILSADGTAPGWKITSLELEVFPAAAIVRSRVDLDPSAKTVRTASGRTATVTTVTTDGVRVTVIHVFDGPNYLQILAEGYPVARVLKAVDPLVAQLDAGR